MSVPTGRNLMNSVGQTVEIMGGAIYRRRVRLKCNSSRFPSSCCSGVFLAVLLDGAMKRRMQDLTWKFSCERDRTPTARFTKRALYRLHHRVAGSTIDYRIVYRYIIRNISVYISICFLTISPSLFTNWSLLKDVIALPKEHILFRYTFRAYMVLSPSETVNLDYCKTSIIATVWCWRTSCNNRGSTVH